LRHRRRAQAPFIGVNESSHDSNHGVRVDAQLSERSDIIFTFPPGETLSEGPRVEVSGQLSNQSVNEKIGVLWALTRHNVASISSEDVLPDPQLAVRSPTRVCRPLEPAGVEELIQGYVDGLPIGELATQFGIDPSTLQRHARRRGLPRRSPRLGPRQSEEAARLYLAGQSLAKLSKRFGVATDTVAVALRRNGVTLRPRRGW
jgi:hypothetical protein